MDKWCGLHNKFIGLKALDIVECESEHKYEIVKKLQEKRHICGMTGDGVNDAPALKKADIGIAVAEATDAARSASDIVLTEPGLSVIISAVLTSRAIFQRMKNYTVSFIPERHSRLCIPQTDSFFPTEAYRLLSFSHQFSCFPMQIYAVSITIRIVVSSPVYSTFISVACLDASAVADFSLHRGIVQIL